MDDNRVQWRINVHGNQCASLEDSGGACQKRVVNNKTNAVKSTKKHEFIHAHMHTHKCVLCCISHI